MSPHKIAPELIARIERELRENPQIARRPEIGWLIVNRHVTLPPAFFCSHCHEINDRAPQRYCRECHRAAVARSRAKYVRIERARYEALVSDAEAYRRQLAEWASRDKPLRVIAGGRP